MANTLTVVKHNDKCEFWTPWGPQTGMTNDAKLASVRRPLKKLGKGRKGRTLDDAYASRPECAYEP